MQPAKKNLELQCDVDIEFNEKSFHLASDGQALILSSKKILSILPLLGLLNRNAETHMLSMEKIHGFLTNNNLTLCVHNRHIGILGQRANRALYGLIRFMH